MLVVSRKSDEGVIIGNQVIIKVLSIQGDRVKIGIEAPRTMKVLRLELYEDISQENKRAINVAKDVIEKIIKDINL